MNIKETDVFKMCRDN